jgi:hypothetical protein
MEQVKVKSLGSATMSLTPPLLVPSPPDLVDTDALFVKELCDLLASLEVASLDLARILFTSWQGRLRETKSRR